MRCPPHKLREKQLSGRRCVLFGEPFIVEVPSSAHLFNRSNIKFPKIVFFCRCISTNASTRYRKHDIHPQEAHDWGLSAAQIVNGEDAVNGDL